MWINCLAMHYSSTEFIYEEKIPVLFIKLKEERSKENLLHWSYKKTSTFSGTLYITCTTNRSNWLCESLF